LVALLVAVLALAPASALAEPLCTDTWTGANEGLWQTGSNWSTGKVPSSTDAACIEAGKTVKVTEGTNQAGVLEDKGTLVMSGGSLEIVSALEASSAHALTLSGGTLTGPGVLDVSSSLLWSGGTMSGSGSTVLGSAVSATVESGFVTLGQRTLVNEGTLTFSSGEFAVRDGAVIKNSGTFNANSESAFGLFEQGGSTSAVLFVNTGTFRKTAGVGTTLVQLDYENKGTVNAKTTTFAFRSKKTLNLASGSVLEGLILLGEDTVTGESFKAPSGTVTLNGGELNMTSGSTATIAHFAFEAGTLTGPGALDASTSLLWNGGTMSGSGSTVLGSAVSGTIEGGSVTLSQRTLVNEGTLTFSSGEFPVRNGSVIKNTGTFNANSESAFDIFEQAGSEAPVTFVNTGTFQKTAGVGTTRVQLNFENKGTVNAKGGTFAFLSKKTLQLANSSVLEGSIILNEDTVTGESFKAPSGTVTLNGGELNMTSGNTGTIANFAFETGTLTGPGTLDVSSSLSWKGGTMSGSGSTVLGPGVSATAEGGMVALSQRTLVNEGTLTFSSGEFALRNSAVIKNSGTFNANSESAFDIFEQGGSEATVFFINTGTFQKTAGTGTTFVQLEFENNGAIHELTGHLKFTRPITGEASRHYGSGNPSAPGLIECKSVDPVSCATGNYSETQTDFSVGGRGLGLNLTRTYNSQAGAEGAKGVFGFGWTSSFSDHLVVNKTSKVTTLNQANGSTVAFTEETGGAFKAPTWTQDTLNGTEGTGYTLTLASQVKYKFAGASGRLESVTDRDGNATTFTYNEAGQLTTITDPTSRTIKLAYNGEGLVESAEDPMKHVVKYTYEGGNLKSVTQPAEAGLRWQFKYDGSHQMTELLDGREGKTVNEYNASHQVTLQKDPAGRELGFEYEAFHTKITNKTTGSVTDERFTSNDEPFAVTRGFGTTSATTQSFTYNAAGLPLTVTDGNEHTTKYGYNAAGDKTSETDPNSNETKWTYNATHDVETMTTPKGETTTIKREAHGNPETIERPAPASKTQITKYKYKTTGELESVEDPLKRITKYEYDTHGNRSAEIDPLTNKRTWEYNEDSQETATVSPKGNVTGGKPAEFTTKIERDAQGRPLKIEDPLKHTTKYTYDGDGNVKTVTDGNSHTTTYTYNGDNQPTKVEAPNKAVTETEYDGAGQVVSQMDSNKNVTKYTRNPVEEVTEVTDPLSRVTKKTYDAAGNLKTLEDPAKRTTTYKYDAANRLTEVSYSSGKPATVTYEYDKDGDRTKMIDGTGTTKYTYDQLDRLTESENGHKEISKYEYDLANQQIKITYPNKKAVTRAFDKDGRLEKVTDWLTHITKFGYNENSGFNATTFPSETKNEDKTPYNNADQITEVKMLKSGTETLASLVYTRDNDGQVKKTTSKGLPGAEITENTYDENNRLTKSGIEYKYDPANNPTTIGTGTYKYDKGDELETGPSLTYTYDELGERTKTKPTTGPATTYGYDQAQNLTSAERPEGESKPKIEDTYAYNGEGLRTSQTINGTTTNLAWDMTEGLPLILSDETNSYIYGPEGIPVEQISAAETPTYLHHDQQGSIRLLTGSAGTVTGKCTYTAYGTPTCEGTTTTPLGYDGQYTSTDTGLIYLRARTYDPATAQFLSADPIASLTRAPYNYAQDNPLNYLDRTGLAEESIGQGSSCPPGICFPFPNGKETERAVEAAKELGHEIGHTASEVGSEIANGAESIVNEVKGDKGGNPAQEKKLTPGELKKLKEAGYDPHELKPGKSTEELYKDREGNITTKPNNTRGAPGEPTGLNIKSLGCGPFE
jgi:RHS repeat-associated protein